jgi:hypothetical protein
MWPHSGDNGNGDPGGDEGRIQWDTGKPLDEREKVGRLQSAASLILK